MRKIGQRASVLRSKRHVKLVLSLTVRLQKYPKKYVYIK